MLKLVLIKTIKRFNIINNKKIETNKMEIILKKIFQKIKLIRKKNSLIKIEALVGKFISDILIYFKII